MHDGCGRTRRRARRKLARCSSAQLPPGPEQKAEAHTSARTHAEPIGKALTIDTKTLQREGVTFQREQAIWSREDWHGDQSRTRLCKDTMCLISPLWAVQNLA